MIYDYKHIIGTHIHSESAKALLFNLIELIKIARHNENECYKLIIYFIYRLCCFNCEFPKQDIEEILKQVCNSEYEKFHKEIVETINAFTKINKDPNLKEYRNRLDKTFPFLQLKRNRQGEVYSDDTRLNRNKFFNYLLDVFKLRIIEKQPAIWNGNGYLLGIDPLEDRLIKLQRIFEIDGVNTEKYIKDYCIKGLSNQSHIDQYLIPCLDKVIAIDKKHIDFEHLKIENHVTSKPTVNPIQVALGDLNIKDIEQAFYDEETDHNFDLWSNNDKDIRALLEETIGLVLIHASGLLFRKAVFLHSKAPKTGKTTFCNFVKALVGTQNTSILSLDDLQSSKNRFKLTMLVGKRLNFGDELAQGKQLDSDTIATLKNIINCNDIPTERKGIQAEDSPMTCTFLYACNDIPYFNDRAMEDRLIIIPFMHTFTDSTLRESTRNNGNEKALKYFLLMGLKGAIRILDRLNKGEYPFTKSLLVEEHRKEIKQGNDPLFRYIYEHEERLRAYDFDYLKQPVKSRMFKLDYLISAHYKNFQDYCNEGKYYQRSTPPTKAKFIERVCDELKMKAIKGDFRSCYNDATTGYKAQGQVFSSL
ncbi:DUF5906 domain-containing protein [Succinivibrio dextrinosolvens]|uniref:DUF5906 domain-containing protein n=1 Tax=Succinivibrio dextrinosolvens TaxID=83771 RepID=UPI0004E0FA15|nr:DUF5906 domain-containing protein [Succinivibrio dextrinosolvens]